MNVTMKLTLDGLVRALRWRQIEFLENPARQMNPFDPPDAKRSEPLSKTNPGVQDVQ